VQPLHPRSWASAGDLSAVPGSASALGAASHQWASLHQLPRRFPREGNEVVDRPRRVERTWYAMGRSGWGCQEAPGHSKGSFLALLCGCSCDLASHSNPMRRAVPGGLMGRLHGPRAVRRTGDTIRPCSPAPLGGQGHFRRRLNHLPPLVGASRVWGRGAHALPCPQPSSSLAHAWFDPGWAATARPPPRDPWQGPA
jgi:hypothetical protein